MHRKQALSDAAQRIEGYKIEGLSEEIDKVNKRYNVCTTFALKKKKKPNREISPTACSWVVLLWFDKPNEGGWTKCHTDAITGRNFEGQNKKGQ